MGSLINSLNEIYEIKQEIKEILNTDEEVFSYYPGLIEQAISTGGAYGTVTLESNGTHEIGAYAYAYVNVPQQEVPVVPPGYTYVYGGKEIITNGNNIDIASYSYINVSVPAPEGWLYPSGYAYITTNGDFNIREFNAVNVNVPQSGLTWDEVVSYGYVFPTGTYAVTANGTYPVGNYAYTYVNIQGGAAVLGYTTITTNGTTYASSFDLDGFSYVNVEVPTGGSYELVNWEDLFDESLIMEHPEEAWIGPADGTLVQMTNVSTDAASALGSYVIDNSLISTISGAGGTDAANHLSSYIGSYLTIFTNPYSGMEYTPMWIVTPEYIAPNKLITVQGPLYELGAGQNPLYWWCEIDSTTIFEVKDVTLASNS